MEVQGWKIMREKKKREEKLHNSIRQKNTSNVGNRTVFYNYNANDDRELAIVENSLSRSVL